MPYTSVTRAKDGCLFMKMLAGFMAIVNFLVAVGGLVSGELVMNSIPLVFFLNAGLLAILAYQFHLIRQTI